MAVITVIDGIPLFDSQSEALIWAQAAGLNGFHTHQYQGQTGYMGGISHSLAVSGPVTIPTSIPTITSTSGSY